MGSRVLFPPSPPKKRKLFSPPPPLLEGLSTLFKLNLDTLPNLSRDPTIFPPGSVPAVDEMAALFIGPSNADRLANSAATLGIVTETVTTGGWVLTTDAVTEILPQVAAYCAALAADAPVVIYCLDNSSFCCADTDGQLSAISKQDDGVYHVIGEIVVVRPWFHRLLHEDGLGPCGWPLRQPTAGRPDPSGAAATSPETTAGGIFHLL